MLDDGPHDLSVRRRVAVVEALLGTVARSLDKLVTAVETLAELVNQQRGPTQTTSRLDTSMIATGAGLAASITTLLFTIFQAAENRWRRWAPTLN